MKIHEENTKNINEIFNEIRRTNSVITCSRRIGKCYYFIYFPKQGKKGWTKETKFSCVLCYKFVSHRLVLGEKGVTCKRLEVERSEKHLDIRMKQLSSLGYDINRSCAMCVGVAILYRNTETLGG